MNQLLPEKLRSDRLLSLQGRNNNSIPAHILFFRLPINFALQKIWQMQVAQQSRRCLNVAAKASQFLWYTWKFLTQFLHTPDITWLPCSARSPPHPAKLRRTALLFRQPKAKSAPPPFSNAYIATSFLYPLSDYILFSVLHSGQIPSNTALWRNTV